MKQPIPRRLERRERDESSDHLEELEEETTSIIAISIIDDFRGGGISLRAYMEKRPRDLHLGTII